MKKAEKKPALKLAPEVLFIFALVAVLGYYAVWRTFNPVQAVQQPAVSELETQLEKQRSSPPPIDSPVRDELTEYYEKLADFTPTYVTRDMACPLDNTPLKLPVLLRNGQGLPMDNAEGGIASDFMKIAVGVPDGGSAMPDLMLQQWEQLPVICPTCNNVYQDASLNNLRWPQRLQALKQNWDLERISAGLKRYGYRDWTPDQLQYGHYLSSREAQMEHLELGWIALSGAYASNFSVWSGEHEYHIPSSAFYALAAAEFRRSIELDWEGLPDKSKSETIMALLVCERLLGREEDAGQTLAQAREILRLEPQMLPALDVEQQLLNAGRFSLERVNLQNRPAPVIGWQLDKMLPAMNGHISEYREAWQGLTGTQEILEAIEAQLQQKADERAIAANEAAARELWESSASESR